LFAKLSEEWERNKDVFGQVQLEDEEEVDGMIE